MLAAVRCFSGHGENELLPYLSEYLLCSEFHWSWRDLQEMPASVLDHWLVYRSARIYVENGRRD